MGLAHQRENAVDQVEDRHRRFGPEIERLTHELVVRQPFGELQIRVYRIAHVEVVANEGSVAADDRRLVEQCRPDRTGNQPVEIQIPATEQIAAPGDCHRRPVSVKVRERDQIRAALGDIVRKAALKGRILGVRQHIVASVRLVTRRHDHPLHDPAARLASLEQVPGTADVRLEGGKRGTGRRADDGLRA